MPQEDKLYDVPPTVRKTMLARMNWYVIIPGLVFLGGLLAGIIVWHNIRLSKPLITQTDYPGIHFPALVPTKKLPAYFSYKANSVSVAQGILIYQLQSGSKPLNVTEQARPKSFNLDDFYIKEVDVDQKIVSNFGDTAIGHTKAGQFFVSITSSKTWLFATSDTDISVSHIKALINSLKLIND